MAMDFPDFAMEGYTILEARGLPKLGEAKLDALARWKRDQISKEDVVAFAREAVAKETGKAFAGSAEEMFDVIAAYEDYAKMEVTHGPSGGYTFRKKDASPPKKEGDGAFKDVMEAMRSLMKNEMEQQRALNEALIKGQAVALAAVTAKHDAMSNKKEGEVEVPQLETLALEKFKKEDHKPAWMDQAVGLLEEHLK